jgi:hypothetical protein
MVLKLDNEEGSNYVHERVVYVLSEIGGMINRLLSVFMKDYITN